MPKRKAAKAKAQPAEQVHGATPQDVTIRLRGIDYHLIFNYRALEVAEMKLAAEGHNVNMLLQQDMRSVGANRMPFLFFAALVSKHPEITFAQAKRLIDLRTNLPIYNAVCDAYLIGMTQAKAEEDEDAHPTEEPPGR